jgi:hypothetical protein
VISALYPGFLAAGVVFATVPVVLHLLARRPPHRRPLPTARFLRREERTLLRPSRRPSDLLLLAVRVLFALVLGACFAGLAWTADRAGTERIVLVDTEAAADLGMDALAVIAREATADADRSGVATKVIGYAASEHGDIVTSADLSELVHAVGEPMATAADGLRVLRSAAIATAFDSAEVVWVARPTWHQWTEGVGLLREALWPGALQLQATGLGTARVAPDAPRAPVSAELLGFPEDTGLRRALIALGARLLTGETGTPEDASWIFAENPPADMVGMLVEKARAGATVILSGALPNEISADGEEVPWEVGADTRSGGDAEAQGTSGRDGEGAILRLGARPLGTAVQPEAGGPSSKARVIAVFEDTRPAAAARAAGAGCIVYFAASLQDAQLSREAGFPDLVGELARGCGSKADPTLPLDRGGIWALTRPDLPQRVELADLDTSQGTPLAPGLLLLALALLGAEVLLTREKQG